MCTHVDVENIPTQQITTVMTTVRAASTSSPHDCVSTACIACHRHCPRSSQSSEFIRAKKQATRLG